MLPKVIADSDDEDDYDASPVKVTSRPSTTLPGIAMATTATTTAAMEEPSSNPAPDTARTEYTDEILFQHVHNEHKDAALRQFAIQNLAATTARMGQPSSRPECDGSSSGDKASASDDASPSENGGKGKTKHRKKADTSSLTDPGHPSKHRKHNNERRSKVGDTSDITNISTPARSPEKVWFDPYAFIDSSPERESGPRIKHVKPKPKPKPAAIDETQYGSRSSHPSSVALPSSFKKMRQALASSLTHVTETPNGPSDPIVAILRNSPGGTVPPESDHSAKQRRPADLLSHIAETPEHGGEVDFVPVTVEDGPGGGGPSANFYIQPSTMTPSQMMEYQPVDPTPSLNTDYGLPHLPATGYGAYQSCSGDVSTVAYSTPSRFQSTGPRALVETQGRAGNMHESSPQPPPSSAGAKTRIVLKQRSVQVESTLTAAAANHLATNVTEAAPFLSEGDVLMIDSSPDEISNRQQDGNGENYHAGGAVISQDLDAMPPQLRSARAKKRQSMEDEDELSGFPDHHSAESSNSRPTKRRLLPYNTAGDREEAAGDVPVVEPPAAVLLNDTTAASAPAPTLSKTQRTQKRRGRKKKEPSVTAETDTVSTRAGAADTEVAQAAQPTEKAKKRRGRPRKPHVATPQPGIDQAESPMPTSEQVPARLERCAAPVEIASESSSNLSRLSQGPGPAEAGNVLKETTLNVSKSTSESTKGGRGDQSATMPEGLGDTTGHDGKEGPKEAKDTKGVAEKRPVPASRYRVGLSRNARIQPLLKVIRK